MTQCCNEYHELECFYYMCRCGHNCSMNSGTIAELQYHILVVFVSIPHGLIDDATVVFVLFAATQKVLLV